MLEVKVDALTSMILYAAHALLIRQVHHAMHPCFHALVMHMVHGLHSTYCTFYLFSKGRLATAAMHKCIGFACLTMTMFTTHEYVLDVHTDKQQCILCV